MAMGGISAFVIVFAVYPVAAPLFRKANITKNLMPGIFLGASVGLCISLPGNPSLTNALLTTTALGTNAYAGAKMGIVACIFGTILCALYLIWATKRETAKGVVYVVSGTDAASVDPDRKLPPFWSSILPLVVVILMMFFLKDIMSTTNCITTALLAAMALVVVFNFKMMKGKILKTFTDGMWDSVTALILTAGVMGFGSVVNNARAFQYFVDFAMSISNAFNPYVSGAVAVNILAGITGTALGGLQIFTNTLLPNYLGLNINPQAFHRIMVIATCGLDSLPHCATYISMCIVCGVATKGSYKHVVPLSIIIPVLMTALCIILALIGFI
jgi:H+/gluconate symporter-like permease